MGKSSSSRRKKRSKISSKKKSKKMSKSRKLKSKKLQNRDDSLSFSDGSSSTFSSSDPEDDSRGRKPRSSARKDGKKRAKRQSSSSDDYTLMTRKRPKRRAYDEMKKKTNSKKKRKRDLSISSFSSESRSCSTCRSESSRTIESEFDRGISAKKHKKKKDLETSKSVNKHRGHRSRSCTPYTSCDRRSDYSIDEEKIIEYNYNSKRLKSVIVIQGNENREYNNEERVEEITFGDSAFEEEPMQDHGRKVEVIFNSRNLELDDTGKDNKCQRKGMEGSVNGRKTEFSADTVSKNDVDMELILRQKALENLKRFRGGREKSTKTHANQKVEGECDATNASFVKVELPNFKFPEDGDKVIDQESLKMDNANMVCSKLNKEEDSKSIIATEAIKVIDLQKGQHDSAHSSQNISNGSDGGGGFKQGSSHSAVEERMDQAINKSKEEGSDQNSNDRPSSLSVMPEENNSSTKPQNESKEGSQFEQKTMSVMRGGEMVEVSYKVYIPKKAPALSRRLLKR